jgi:hypothetical protein
LTKIGERYGVGYKCENLVRDIYEQVGVSSDFNDHPVLSFEDIRKEKFVGYLCFLKNKKYTQELYRFSHVGIIFPNHQLLHYSRYFGEPNIREVFLTSFSKIFEVYNFVFPCL